MEVTLKDMKLPVTVQCTLEDQESIASFRHFLALLVELGYYGIEINLPELDIINPEELENLVGEYGLHITMLATGAYAKRHGLSLSNPDPEKRAEAINGCIQNLKYASSLNAGIILGFFKGGPGQNKVKATEYLMESLIELKPYAEQYKVPILIEATNRYETSVIHTLAEGSDLLKKLDCSYYHVLPDLFHMQIEEKNIFAALNENSESWIDLHFSDNNRLFAGLGTFDFKEIYKYLIAIGYKNTICLEGNTLNGLLEDTKLSAAYLNGIKALI